MKHVQKGFTSPSQDGAENEKAKKRNANANLFALLLNSIKK